MNELKRYLEQHAVAGVVPGECLNEARLRFSLTHSEIERLALGLSLLPGRYQRNRETISVEQQRLLNSSRVSVVGCGGLGGYIIEQLTRLGVGEIQLIDGDVFEEHNLNRQLYSSPDMLGASKVDVAIRRVHEINPAVRVLAAKERLDLNNGRRLLEGANIVAGAVDSLEARHHIAACCRELGIPMVHGAIAGWYGQISTIYPEDPGPEKLYPQRSGKGIEQELGNPALLYFLGIGCRYLHDHFH